MSLAGIEPTTNPDKKCESAGSRTPNQRLKRALLCQLSYGSYFIGTALPVVHLQRRVRRLRRKLRTQIFVLPTFHCALGESRTPNPQFRRLMLYPLSYERKFYSFISISAKGRSASDGKLRELYYFPI